MFKQGPAYLHFDMWSGLERQVFFLALELEFKLLDDDPDLDSFHCENGTIQTMVEGSYFAVVRQQGLAYAVLRDGDVVGYCMIKVGAVEYQDPEAYDESDAQLKTYVKTHGA